MYTHTRYCIYNHQTGLYYQGSLKWNDYDHCKIYSQIGHAKSALSQYPHLKEDCTIYTVRVQLGDAALMEMKNA